MRFLQIQIAKSLTCLAEHEADGTCICVVEKAFADAHRDSPWEIFELPFVYSTNDMAFFTHPNQYSFWMQGYYPPGQAHLLDTHTILTRASDPSLFHGGLCCQFKGCTVSTLTLDQMTSHLKESHSTSEDGLFLCFTRRGETCLFHGHGNEHVSNEHVNDEHVSNQFDHQNLLVDWRNKRIFHGIPGCLRLHFLFGQAATCVCGEPFLFPGYSIVAIVT